MTKFLRTTQDLDQFELLTTTYGPLQVISEEAGGGGTCLALGVYVDGSASDPDADGSACHPYTTIAEATAAIVTSGATTAALYLRRWNVPGEHDYEENVTLPPAVEDLAVFGWQGVARCRGLWTWAPTTHATDLLSITDVAMITGAEVPTGIDLVNTDAAVSGVVRLGFSEPATTLDALIQVVDARGWTAGSGVAVYLANAVTVGNGDGLPGVRGTQKMGVIGEDGCIFLAGCDCGTFAISGSSCQGLFRVNDGAASFRRVTFFGNDFPVFANLGVSQVALQMDGTSFGSWFLAGGQINPAEAVYNSIDGVPFVLLSGSDLALANGGSTNLPTLTDDLRPPTGLWTVEAVVYISDLGAGETAGWSTGRDIFWYWFGNNTVKIENGAGGIRHAQWAYVATPIAPGA